MAGTSQLTLEVLIKAVADAKGITVTKQEVDKLADSMRQAAGASGSLDTSVGAITESLQRQKTVTESAGTSWDKLTDAQKQAHREAAQVAVRNLEAAEAAKKASAEAATLGRNVNTAKTAFSGLRDVFSGALNGNLLQVGSGIGKISSAVTNASPALKSFFSQVARGAAAGSVIAGPALVAIAAARQKAEENQKAIDKIYKEQADSSEAYTALIEGHAKRREEALTKELKAVQTLSQAYEDSRARTDKAYDRDEKLTPLKRKLRDEKLDTQEKEELSRAGTPEAKARIKAKYDLKRKENAGNDTRDELDTADARADIEITKGQDAINQANQKAREADQKVAEAERAFETARQGTRIFKPTDNSAAAQAARDKALAAQENLKRTKEDRDKILGETGEIVKSAQEEIDAANLVKEETALRRAAYEALAKGKIAENKTPNTELEDKAKAAGGSVAEIEAAIAAEKERASRSRKFGDTANTGDLEKQLAEARASEAAAKKAVAEDAQKRKKENDLFKRQIKNTAGGANL